MIQGTFLLSCQSCFTDLSSFHGGVLYLDNENTNEIAFSCGESIILACFYSYSLFLRCQVFLLPNDFRQRWDKLLPNNNNIHTHTQEKGPWGVNFQNLSFVIKIFMFRMEPNCLEIQLGPIRWTLKNSLTLEKIVILTKNILHLNFPKILLIFQILNFLEPLDGL
jgi:hypothetical protein